MSSTIKVITMQYPAPQMTSDQIRAIRLKLGLTQVQAGELIGGGPRAFSKYETGTTKPSAGTMNLLRVLEANPDAISTLRGHQAVAPYVGNHPFEVSSAELRALAESTLPLLLKRLLSAEAQTDGLPPSVRIHVSSNIHSPDGGEDGRITWIGGPAHTQFLPSRFNQFQLKAAEISPVDSASDVLTRCGKVKGMVKEALESCGNYIMVCTHPYAQKQIDDRKKRIREAIRQAGVVIDDCQVDFRDADQLAMWVNCHPSVAVWWKEQVQPGSIGPFRSWFHWASRPEHEHMPFVEDERFATFRANLNDRVHSVRSVTRVVGLQGVGKSRLTLEALSPTEEDVLRGTYLSDIVMYAVQSESSSEIIRSTVRNLADLGKRAIVVVDHCDPETRLVLIGMVMRQSSNLSLITIEDGFTSSPTDEFSISVDKASLQAVETIIDHVSPDLPMEDRRRLVRFSEGLPKVAARMAVAWGTQSFAISSEDTFVDAYVLGRSPQNHELLKSAELLSVFDFVSIDPPVHGQLTDISTLGRDISADALYEDISDLVDQGIARRRGRLVTIEPPMISMNLAERQWRRWNYAKWDAVLAGDIDVNLKISAARQLALLNTTEIAKNVVQHVCRVGGPFDGFKELSKPYHAEILSALAEVCPQDVVYRIKHSLDAVGDLSNVKGDVRRHLVTALQTIAIHPSTFEDAAILLLCLAVAENEMWTNNATGQFVALFPLLLGETAADGSARLTLLEEVIDTDNVDQRVVAAKALIEGIETSHFSRTLGAESQGTQPAIKTWEPASPEEAIGYIKGCLVQLKELALLEDAAGNVARAGLSNSMDSLILDGFIDVVEEIVNGVVNAVGYWPEAVKSLRFVLDNHSESLESEVTERITSLIAELQPKSLEGRLEAIVRDMWWENCPSPDYVDPDLTYLRQAYTVLEITGELMCEPTLLKASIDKLAHGQPGMADILGISIARLTETPTEWLEAIVRATSATPEDIRNYDLLSGYVTGVAMSHPTDADAFMQRAARVPALAPVIPQIASRLGIKTSDVQLAIYALLSGFLPPRRLHAWALGRVLTEVPARVVARLFDALTTHSYEGFTATCTLMGMYAYGDFCKLEALRPQVVGLAKNAELWRANSDRQSPGQQVSEHHFEKIMKWMLAKGKDDPFARATALVLAKWVADVKDLRDVGIIKSILPVMLADFPEIVWPLLGNAVVSDGQRAVRLKYMLGDRLSVWHKSNPVILHLPEDTLFAWCHAHPERAPAFLTSILPITKAPQSDQPDEVMHPVMLRLVEEFGDREDVKEATMSNIHSYTTVGSLASHFSLYEDMFKKLRQHPKPKVRRWARNIRYHLQKNVDDSKLFDDEIKARWRI